MASYRLFVRRSAAKEIEAIGQERDRERVMSAIGTLTENPHPAESEKLAGRDDRYRIRVGNYRVLCSIADAALIVCVVKVGHRREVYRRAVRSAWIDAASPQ